MLHLLYILAFTIIAFLAVRNLIHSLLSVGMDSQRWQAPGGSTFGGSSQFQNVPHPELLDEYGELINEPLLVMRSFSVQEARHQLDNLYQSSPGLTEEPSDEVDKNS